MLLTKRGLHKILRNWRIPSIPTELEKELLEDYGHCVVTEEGLTIEYSEQDICEQLRKILRPYMRYGRVQRVFFSRASISSTGKEGWK